MKNKYSDGSLRRYIEYFVFRHVFLHEQVFMGKFVPSPLTYLPRTTKQTKMAAWAELLKAWLAVTIDEAVSKPIRCQGI